MRREEVRTERSVRQYRGDGFTVDVPLEWVDRTVHTFSGPPDGDFVPGLWIISDPAPAADQAPVFAEERIRVSLENLPNGRLQQRKRISLRARVDAVRAEIRWYPTDAQRHYQRSLYLIAEGHGYTLTTELTKRTRLTAGPSLDRIMESFSPRGAATAAVRPGGERRPYEADRFTLQLEEGWRSETVHVLTDPSEGSFRRTLLISKEVIRDGPAADDDRVREEISGLKSAVPGFTLLTEGPVQLGDGMKATRIESRRKTSKDRTVVQLQVMVPREDRLYTLTLTAEEGLPRAEWERLSRCVAMFREFSASGGLVDWQRLS